MTVRALRAAAVAVAAAGLVTIAVAVVALTAAPGPHRTRAIPTVEVGVLPAIAATSPVRAAGTATTVPDPVAPGAHTRLRLPRLGLDAEVVRVRLAGHVMQVPRDPARVGWWTGGAVPGAARGSAVLVGHVNYAGVAGAFSALPRMRPGDLLTQSSPAGRFRVDAVRSYAKTSGLPRSIFAVNGPAQLVLVTCGGSFDARTGNYRDNIVVYAHTA